MELKTLRCPSCEAGLELKDGLDTFYCTYCGHKIILEGQSAAAYEAKTRFREMEHKEKLQDKAYERKRLKIEAEEKESRRGLKALGVLIALYIAMTLGFCVSVDIEKRQLEKKLEDTVEQIMVDIENEDFASAYIKANTLYWDEGLSSEEGEKWDATREEVIRQIEIAEEEASKKSDAQDDGESDGFSGWFNR